MDWDNLQRAIRRISQLGALSLLGDSGRVRHGPDWFLDSDSCGFGGHPDGLELVRFGAAPVWHEVRIVGCSIFSSEPLAPSLQPNRIPLPFQYLPFYLSWPLDENQELPFLGDA